MNVKKEYLSPCGMYCGVCATLAADRDNDQELKEKIASVFGTKPEQITCDGCRSEKTFQFAKICAIRACADEKQIQGCHQCGDFPCNHFKTFPIEIAKQGMLEGIARRKELGTEQWVAETEKRFTCPHCGFLMHRYATQCNRCQKPIG
jgi:hypothetical protein